MSDTISPDPIRTKTAKEIANPKTIGLLRGIMNELQLPSTQTRFCMHCGTMMKHNARTCQSCGKTPPAGYDVKACHSCGSTIPSAAKFCSECGLGQKTDAEKITPPFKRETKINKVQENVNKLLLELDKSIKSAQRYNQGECNIQKALSLCLFAVGLILILAGFFLNQYVALAFGTMFEFLVALALQ